MPKTVFISHASPDKPAVEALANALRARGHAVWLDKYELSPQQSFVRQINDGLERADAGIVVFSEHTKQSAWVQAELDALLYAYIQERQPLIPVKLAEDAPIPPLLRPLLYRRIDEHEAISDALDNRKPVPQDVDAQAARTDRVRIRLDKTEDDRIAVAVTFNDAPEPFVETAYDALPAAIVQGREGFLRDFRAGLRRDADTARRSAMTRTLHALGEALRDFCLPGGARAALAAMLSATRVGDTVEVWFEAADAELLGLPLEALRLGDGRVLAVVPEVVVLRRVTDLAPLDFTPLPGPLKILVAVGAPDEGLSTAAVLDHERELQNILNATEQAHRSDTAQVRILEVGHPQAISEALERDDYHVLHLSCHGNAGVLLLETEDGEEMKVKPADLLEPIRGEGRTLPLVVLNACHGGVPDAQTGSFAHALLDAGVPCVLAMQTSVSDYYATELAAAFYRVLYRREHQRPSRALAKARKALEAARQKALQTEAPLYQTQPEYATPTLFVRDEAEPRLANFGPHREPLSTPPVYALAGPVPQLSRDAFIGRRKPLRQALRTIRTDTAKAGVLLTGIGGVGKSALAGRAMRRLVESGYVPVAHKGVWDLGAIATSVGTELMQMSDEALQKKGTLLFQPELPDTARLTLLQQVLATVPLLLVLDDFEQNLTAGGAAFRDGAVADYLQMLAHNARTSRLLLTCRYPLPATDLAAYFETVPLGPLSDAEARKLMRRLPAFEDLDPKEWARILRLVGGHPRMLEFVDALLNRGKGRLPEVENKLREILEEQGVSADAAVADVDAAIQQAILVGARDVLLEQLVDLAGAADAREA
ncbi:MAG: TIR domain-containing protein, partial [Bacteroidota bacterium]